MNYLDKLFKTDKYITSMVDSRLKDIKNLDKTFSEDDQAINIPDFKHTRYRYKQELDDWILAIQQCELVELPQWKYLLDIFRNVSLDSKVTSKVNQRLNKTILQSFTIADMKTGEVDDELTEKFNREWFRNFMRYTIEAVFYGFSAIQIRDIEDSVPSSVDLIDRYYVIPEKKCIRKQLDDTVGIPFDQEPYEDSIVFIQKYDKNKVNDLGLFSKIAQYFILKKTLLLNLSETCEVYGMPTRIVKVPHNADLEAIEHMLKFQGSNGWGIIPENTEYETSESSVEHAENIYTGYIKLLDDYISNMITGEVLDNSTNYSNSKEFMKLADQQSFMDNLLVEETVNGQLFKKLINLGAKEYEGKVFRFTYSDNLTIKEEFERDVAFMQYLDLDLDYLQNKYGIEIEGRKLGNPIPLKSDQLENYYRHGRKGDS